jgi:hypothetical protein
MLTWGYYGLKAWSYLFGKSRTSEITFRTVWSLFVVAGTSSGAASRRPPWAAGTPRTSGSPPRCLVPSLGTRQPHLVERGYFQDSGAWANGLSDVAINNIDYLELDSWSIELTPTCDLAGGLRSCSSPPKPLPPPC